MRPTCASADDVFKAFDGKIVQFLDKNRKTIEKEYRERAGRQVQDSELASFLSGLGDQIYDQVDLDPGQLDRFVSFYVNDARLQKLVSDAIESAVAYPRAASAPAFAERLRALAASVSSSPAPSRAEVRAEVEGLLSLLSR